jgi:hypothetical protein
MAEKSHSEMSLIEQFDWIHLPTEERFKRAVPPLKIWCDKGTYKKTRHQTNFDVREYDALDRDLGHFDVRNQRETAVADGKAKHFYVWSCSCRKENCRHISAAKKIYFEQWRKKKNAEEWLLANDPTYLTPKMAAAGYISWGVGAAKARAEGLL